MSFQEAKVSTTQSFFRNDLIQVDYGLTSTHTISIFYIYRSAIKSDLFHFVLLSVIKMGIVHKFSLKFPISTALRNRNRDFVHVQIICKSEGNHPSNNQCQ